MRSIVADVTEIAHFDDCVGETPLWSADENALYWINVLDSPIIRRLEISTGRITHWPMPERIGALALKAGGGAIVGFPSGVYDFDFDFDSGALTLRAASPLPADIPLHEGRCDPSGRFWIGSSNNEFLRTRRLGGGQFFRLDADGLTPVVDDITIANGLAFSPDGRILYLVDSARGVVQAWNCDPATGALSNPGEFAHFPFEQGGLDGAAVDSEGGYWSAVFGPGLLRRWRADGTPDLEIQLPFSQPTMLAFGGRELDTIYITTGWFGLDAEARSREPQLGGLFAMKAPIRGLPEPLFRTLAS